MPRTMDRPTEAEKAIRRGELAKEKGREERKGAGFKKKCKKVLTPRGRFGIINERSRERRTLTSK